MGKKYIVEIGDNENLYKTTITNGGKSYMAVVHGEPYTEPDLERVKEEAYLKGLNDGKGVIFESTQNNAFNNGYKKCLKDMEQVKKEAYEQGYYIGYSRYLNKSYEDGLKGSWDAARKIICEMDHEDYMKIFGGDNLDYIFALSPTTVIEKLKAYEQEQEEIKVGDEVIATFGKAVIVCIDDDKDKARYIYPDSTLGFDNVCNLSKTGRHFPEIAAVLEKMRGEQE